MTDYRPLRPFRMLKRSALLVIVVSISAGGIIGCNCDSPQPDATQSPPTRLTAEQARDAMIELIRSEEPGSLEGFPLDRFVNEGVKIGEGDYASWACFSFDLKAREYTYQRKGPVEKKQWHAGYKGKFEFRNGKWIASKPQTTFET
jgi:hypothetical protein